MILLHLPQSSQRAVDLVLGVLPHTAGVVENRVGVTQITGQFIALLLQTGHDHLAVQNIHLAADRLDIKAFRHHSFDLGVKMMGEMGEVGVCQGMLGYAGRRQEVMVGD